MFVNRGSMKQMFWAFLFCSWQTESDCGLNWLCSARVNPFAFNCLPYSCLQRGVDDVVSCYKQKCQRLNENGGHWMGTVK